MNNDLYNQENNQNIINLGQTTNNHDNNIKPISPITEQQSTNPKQTEDDFVNSLPEWDLLPPYETVRRINRL